MDRHTKKLIVKFLAKEANIDELRQLELWIGNPKNESLFHEYIRANAIMNMSVGSYDKKRAKAVIVQRIRKEKTFQANKVKFGFMKYTAAVLIAAVSFGYFYFYGGNSDDTPTVSTPANDNNTIRPGLDKATLILEDGSKVELVNGNTHRTENAKGNSKQIVYTPEENTREIRYNYLTVPRGGQFFIVLADGTKVWLNSETQLKYPVSFIHGLPREVELIYGEAYFEVSPSTDHDGARFIVLNQSQKIEVFGTEFNIEAYRDEKNIYSTLVEGSITVIVDSSEQRLAPGQQSNFHKEDHSITIADADVESVVAWKQGLFIFKKKPLKDIMKVLSRWYDVEVAFEDKDLETLKFRGVISKSQEIEEILSIMKSTTIKDYEIRGKTIILR